MSKLKRDCIMYGTGENPGDKGIDTECRGLKELECAKRDCPFYKSNQEFDADGVPLA